MQAKILVIDDFYDNPDAHRAQALADDDFVLGQYPGKRTVERYDISEEK